MIFYIPDITKKEVENPDSAHMLSMRIKYKDEITITNLKGSYAKIKIKEVDKRHKLIKYWIQKTDFQANNNTNILFQAIPEKNYLEKLVEIASIQGIQKIYLFFSERSTHQTINIERLERIMIRGCELAEQYWKPHLELINFEKLELLLLEQSPTLLHQDKPSIQKLSKNNSVIVGPEGGWSNKELEYFKHLNMKKYSMGKTVYPAWLAGYSYFERIKQA